MSILEKVFNMSLFHTVCRLKKLFVLISDKTIKLWKISERDKRPDGYNLKEDDGRYKDPNSITSLRVSQRRQRHLNENLRKPLSHVCVYC